MEQIRNVKQNIAGSNIASLSWINDHIINFEDGQVIDKGNYRTRKTLESWTRGTQRFGQQFKTTTRAVSHIIE